MVALTRSNLTRPIRRFMHHEAPEHPVIRAAGYGLIALAVFGVLMALPDIKRYLRMKSM